MNGVSGVAGVNAAAGTQPQQGGGLSASQQEALFQELMVQGSVSMMAMLYANQRSIMSESNKQPQ